MCFSDTEYDAARLWVALWYKMSMIHRQLAGMKLKREKTQLNSRNRRELPPRLRSILHSRTFAYLNLTCP